MKKQRKVHLDLQKTNEAKPRRMRVDAQRKKESLVQAATEVFATSGVDAQSGKLLRRRALASVRCTGIFRNGRISLRLLCRHRWMHARVQHLPFAAKYEPGEALARWLHRLMDLLGTKRGLAAALHSGDLAYSALPNYFMQHMNTALKSLLDAAVAAKAVRPGWTPTFSCGLSEPCATDATEKNLPMPGRW